MVVGNVVDMLVVVIQMMVVMVVFEMLVVTVVMAPRTFGVVGGQQGIGYTLADTPTSTRTQPVGGVLGVVVVMVVVVMGWL